MPNVVRVDAQLALVDALVEAVAAVVVALEDFAICSSFARDCYLNGLIALEQK